MGMVKDAAETVAEVVEDVAAAAEKVSSEVAEQLPEGGSLRLAAVLVEHASKEVAEEAHLAQDIIHKDEDKLMEMLTYPKVEEKVTRRVKAKADIIGQEVNPDAPSTAADMAVPKIQPEVAAELYDQWVMPLTKQVQVQYLLKRLD